MKAFEAGRYDVRVVVKHCPDFSFFIAEEAHKRLANRFDRELSVWNGLPDSHLMIIALFSVPPSGFAQVEEAALMPVDENWLPVDGGLDLALLGELVRHRRVFERSLRFNMAPGKPLAIAVLQDSAPKPTGLYIGPPARPTPSRTAWRTWSRSKRRISRAGFGRRGKGGCLSSRPGLRWMPPGGPLLCPFTSCSLATRCNRPRSSPSCRSAGTSGRGRLRACWPACASACAT